VIEPPLFGVAANHPDVAAITAALEAVVHRAPELTASDFASEWAAALGRDSAGVASWTSSFTDRDWASAEASRHEAWAGDAPVDFGALAQASFPKVVVVGGWPETVAHVPSSEAALLLPGVGRPVRPRTDLVCRMPV